MRKSQREQVLEHIDRFGSISSLEAFQEYSITRLAARISDIESSGVRIERETCTYKDQHGRVVHYTRYRRAS